MAEMGFGWLLNTRMRGLVRSVKENGLALFFGIFVFPIFAFSFSTFFQFFYFLNDGAKWGVYISIGPGEDISKFL